MLVDRRSASVVRPARTSEGDRARATDLPLARPLASAVPATSAVPPIEPSPIPTPTPPSIVDTAAPPAPAPLKIDLHRLADQVQRILLRQAEHGRARQGLPR